MYITLAIYLRLPLPLSHTSPPLSYPFSTIPQSPCLSLPPPLFLFKKHFPLLFHSFLYLFSLFLPSNLCPPPSSFYISGPLSAPPTTNTPTYNTPQSSFFPSFHLFAAIFFPPHLILPVVLFLFSPIYHYQPLFPCLSRSPPYQPVLSPLSPTVLPPVSLSSRLAFPFSSSVSSVCLRGQRVVRPACRHQQHRATASGCVCVCVCWCVCARLVGTVPRPTSCGETHSFSS